MEKSTIDNKETPSQLRKLVAIMFADMTGFTAMMQEDEAKAKILRNRQQQTLENLIPAHNGTIVQFFGDGTLSIFDSAIDAVKSAIEIQKELQKEPKVKLRIGIHSGDVVYDTNGLYGDCVNLASRIESISVPGAVLISDKVFDEVKNQSEIKTIPLGKVNLKNVKRPVEVHAIANEGLVIPTTVQIGIKTGSDKSIAVLPFVNMSADPENEYFSDGISEEILNSLTHVEGIRVTARTSSFSFKGKNEDIREIGNKLGVSNILEGTVRRAGKKIRINVQLISAVDGYHIWSEAYDSELEDIFEVQDEIATKIVTRLKENFAISDKKESIVKTPTENIEAYNLYLKGRYYWNKSNPEDILRAIKTFEEAIKLDPNFALPYCALSYCYSFMGSSGLMPPTEAYPKAKDCTLKAIELDPNHAESHLSLATIKFYHNWDFEGAEASLNKAQDLGLNSSLFNQVHGWFLIAKGDFEKAIEKIQQALALDPLSLPLMSTLGDAYSFAGRFEEGLAQYNKIIELEPNFRRGFEGRGMIYLAMGENEKAVKDFEQYHKLVGHPLKGLSSLGHAYAAAGQTDKALEIVEKLKLREQNEPGVLLHMDYAFLYSGMKQFDLAFDYLNKTYDQRMGIACLGMIFCIRYPMLNELKSDPRFKELTQKMGLEK
ncbi:MAG TPA: adenylate/guanylate cyclase domain-containing protein [Chitinophagaceae bacterium]|jgi:TolB-like protein/class 3 adenylate cyclase/Tfp pilus assembly protein PilF|nr:adenylate/guanylate cyclase domain-containing protein [Chitinophagaceae bacterium]